LLFVFCFCLFCFVCFFSIWVALNTIFYERTFDSFHYCLVV
jgi:hypothetical protein